MAGVSQSEISRIEAGLATYASIELWMRVALILERRPRFEVSNDPRQEPTDAGHLGIQELVLRLARQTGRHGIFELPTRSAEAWRSTDVGIRDERHRALILVECWNMIGDIGAAARSTSRKLAEAEQLAVASGGDHSYRVAGCWVVRATRRNRDLVARYPEVFAAKFPGSSIGWVQALASGGPPRIEPRLVWADLNGTRITAWRKRATR